MIPQLTGYIVVTLLVTAYCTCPICCAPYSDGITASGAVATEGRTVAAGPSFPFGTEVYIEGVGKRVVEDRGGAITDIRLDLFFDNHDAALRFGVRTLTVLWKEGVTCEERN